MSRWVPTPAEAGTHLGRVEYLLDQALEDLTGKGRSSPCSRCAGALAEAHAELQSFAGLLTALPRARNGRGGLEEVDRIALRRRVEALLPRLSRAELLLAAAAEFYRGWCAAAPLPSYPASGYQTDAWSHGPALLALEG